MADAADGAVDSWLQRLMTARDAPLAEEHKDHVRYVLGRRESYYVPHVRIEAVVAAGTKRGGFTVKRTIELPGLAQNGSRYVTALDRTIGKLAGISGSLSLTRLSSSPAILGMLLQLLMESERLHWESVSNPALVYAPIENGGVAWQTGLDGRQRPVVAERPSTVLIAAKPVWYADPAACQAGPVDLGLPADLAYGVASAPSLSPEQADRAQPTWQRVLAPFGAPAPVARTRVEYVTDEPAVHLRVRTGTPVPIAELRFAYGDRLVDTSDRTAEFRMHGGRTRLRREDAERRAEARLTAKGLAKLHVGGAFGFADADRAEMQWAQFLHTDVPELRASGWRIEIDEGAFAEVLEAGDDWDAEIASTDNRWFDVDLGITLNGERVALLPLLVSALRETPLTSLRPDAPLIGRLADGRLIALPRERVNRLVETLFELFDDDAASGDDRRLRMRNAQFGLVGELEGLARLQWRGAQALRDLAAAVRDVDPASLQLPPSFHGELRGYQRYGVAWLQALRSHALGGVLADDMGLGKTVQLLAHLAIEKSAGRLKAPVLIVAPTSVVPNWRTEIAHFTPELRAVSLTGMDRAQRYSEVDGTDIALTTYPLLLRDETFFGERAWSVLVLDEAQAVKNPRSKGAQALRRLRRDQCVALTGTPIENHLEELWSIFSFTTPELLPERERFSRLFRTPIEKHGDTARRRALATRIAPFFVRRTKDVVAPELPPKTEIVQRVDLEGAQRDLYETIRLAMHKRVLDEVRRRGLARSRIVVLDALLKLRQVCCDPRLVDLPAAAGVTASQKMEALFEMLPELIEEGRRILLFSQFTSMLDLIEPELARHRIDYVQLRGETKDRVTPVTRFQSGAVPLFLISLKAGGTGLNLTAADAVIHYDPWWNPAVERQATDRAHRIGQDKPVFVYKLIAAGTVEERILEMQQRKADLADALFARTEGAAAFGFEEIEDLFAPM